MLHERFHVQRTVADNGDDQQLVWTVLDVLRSMEVLHPAAQEVWADTELRHAAPGRPQRTCMPIAEISELPPKEQRYTTGAAAPEGPRDRGGLPRPSPGRQLSSSTSKSQVTNAPVPEADAESSLTISISNADSM